MFNLAKLLRPINFLTMKVNTQSVNFNADRKLINFLQNRLDKVETFYSKVISSDVYMKVENTSAKENKIVEIKISVPKDKFVVKKQCKSFEEAVDSACSSLERRLIKQKQKLRLQV